MTITRGNRRILLMAALSQEYGALKRVIKPWRRAGTRSYPCWTAVLSDREVVLLESGMGPKKAREALDWAWDRNQDIVGPFDLVISFGFAGALDPQLRVGDVAFGTRSFFWPDDEQERIAGAKTASPMPTLSSELHRFLRKQGVLEAQIATVQKPQPKATLARHLVESQQHTAVSVNADDFPTSSPVHMRSSPCLVDMESAAVASFCFEKTQPFLLVRAVSDAFEDDIPFDVDALTDGDGRVAPMRALAAVARNPFLLFCFFKAWRKSRKAARRLASVLGNLMNLPVEALLPTDPR